MVDGSNPAGVIVFSKQEIDMDSEIQKAKEKALDQIGKYPDEEKYKGRDFSNFRMQGELEMFWDVFGDMKLRFSVSAERDRDRDNAIAYRTCWSIGNIHETDFNYDEVKMPDFEKVIPRALKSLNTTKKKVNKQIRYLEEFSEGLPP